MPIAGWLATIVAAGLLTGCGSGDSTTGPSAFDWTGTWRGSVTDETAGTGNLTMTLAQTDDRVSGTARIGVLGLVIEGPVDGTVTDRGIQATAESPAPFRCTLSFQGTRSGDTVAGSYASAACLLPVSGSFSMSKD
jgi:hypothetical protein